MINKKEPSVVFMGTPDFAVPTLMAIHNAGFHIPFVVTQPDRPKGRGRTLAPPPVKETAVKLGYRVFQPENIRETEINHRIQEISPDFLVVIAFGQILPLELLQLPNHGAINVHASLLPKYRGPAPIQWALLRGEKKTGATTILMDSGVDTGDMLLRQETDIRAEENADQLHQRLARLGADLLIKTLKQIWEGTVFPQAQKHNEATYAPMLKKKDGRINWNQPAEDLDHFVRAMTSWPGAYSFCGDKRLKIIEARPCDQLSQNVSPGTVIESFPDELRVAASQGALLIEEIQSQSGRSMPTKDFLRGNAIAPGSILE